MNKIQILLFSSVMVGLVACGGKEDKKEDKKDKAEENEAEEVTEEEVKVDYSYVLPVIDTNALTSEAEILAAMEKVVVARKMDDSLAENVRGYEGYYTELTTLYSTVVNKGNAFSATLKSKEAAAFNEKFSGIMSKLYEK